VTPTETRVDKEELRGRTRVQENEATVGALETNTETDGGQRRASPRRDLFVYRCCWLPYRWRFGIVACMHVVGIAGMQ
jgi:hypothetical protein